MNTEQRPQIADDPLGLGMLEAIEPVYDGWAQIKSELRQRRPGPRSWQRTGAWLALAASVLLALTVILREDTNSTPGAGKIPSVATNPGVQTSLTEHSHPANNNLEALIALSQKMETQIKLLKNGNGSIPAESAIYTAELEDLIAHVDHGLSQTPDSLELWGQRVNLLLDLAQIYQQQWQIDYSRMVSL